MGLSMLNSAAKEWCAEMGMADNNTATTATRLTLTFTVILDSPVPAAGINPRLLFLVVVHNMFLISLHARKVLMRVIARLEYQAHRLGRVWLFEHRRIFHGHRVGQSIASASDPLNNMQIRVVERAAGVQPRIRADVGHVDH